MKILHVIRSLSLSHGGPTFCVTRLAAAQSGLGHAVSILFFGSSADENAVRAVLEGLPGGRGITLHAIRAAGAGQWFFAGRVRTALAGALPGIDQVHIHGVWERLLTAAASRSRGATVPYVVTPHGMLDPWSLAQSAARKRVAMAMYARRMLNGAAFIHALNADEQHLMEPLGLRAPIRAIPNGVFLEELCPAPEAGAFRRKHPGLEGDPYLLFLGRLHPKKGLDLLAAAFAQVLKVAPRIRLVVAGPDGGALAPFRARARDLGIFDRVLVPGPLYGPEKLAAICGAACFCLPSRQEGFSVAVLEAMACGIPVVISDRCHFPEVAERGAGRIVPLDAGALAGALIEVLTGSSAASAMGRRGAATVREQYTWARIAGAFIAAYEASRPVKA